MPIGSVEAYGPITAYAYAAYRPELHTPILAEVLKGPYETGLDIGCGTGHSTRALAAYCKRTVGTDQSADMLAQAITQSGIEYRLQQGSRLAFPNRWFDVVTLAGSLNYCKSQHLLDEIIRVCRPGALVVVYDFDIHYAEVAEELFGLPKQGSGRNTYDHAINLSDLDLGRLQEQSVRAELREHTDVELQELAFLLLSDVSHIPWLVDTYGTEDIATRMARAAERRIAEQVGSRFDYHRVPSLAVPTTTYTTVYRLP